MVSGSGEEAGSYTKEGLEYMMYDRQIKEYSFPDFSKLSFAGQQGFFGKLEAQARLEAERSYMTLEQRLGRSEWQNAPPHHQGRLAHMTTRF